MEMIVPGYWLLEGILCTDSVRIGWIEWFLCEWLVFSSMKSLLRAGGVCSMREECGAPQLFWLLARRV